MLQSANVGCGDFEESHAGGGYVKLYHLSGLYSFENMIKILIPWLVFSILIRVFLSLGAIEIYHTLIGF